jgi:high-affinity nickel-transport protein
MMELAVALMLLLLGGLSLSVSLRRGRAAAPPDHGHDHGDDHHHGGDEALARIDRRLGRFGAYRLVRPLVVGLVHGLAGSAAVALLVLGTIREPLWALGYLVVFGVGTIAGMLLVTLALAMSFAYTARRFERLHHGLDVAAGLLSAGFGAFLVYEIGFVHGLFAGHPEWTP